MDNALNPNTFDVQGRSFIYVVDLDDINCNKNKPTRDTYGYPIAVTVEPTHQPADAWGANLISSYTQYGHKPVINLDMPCRLVESSTPGHYHLYIDQEISWRHYKNLLYGFYNSGLIQREWYENALNVGYTTIRPPWVAKGQKPLALREAALPAFTEDTLDKNQDTDKIVTAISERYDRIISQLRDQVAELQSQKEELQETVQYYRNRHTETVVSLGWT